MNALVLAALTVSSLGVLGAPPEVKDGAVAGTAPKTVTYGANSYHQLEAKTGSGYCFVESSFQLRTMGTYASTTSDESPAFLVRLRESKEGKVTLEKQRLSFSYETGDVSASKATTIELREVARNDGVVAWAYREGKSVVVVARGATTGIETPPPNPDMVGVARFVGADECPYAFARVDTSANGAIAQLEGEVWQSKKKRGFFVDASVSKVSRDPEPILAVRVRFKENKKE